jgi:hypothetical protein
MAPPRRDVFGETQKFSAMRDALRRAVGPDPRPARSSRGRAGLSVTGQVLRCPVHGVVTHDRDDAPVDDTSCPVDVLVADDHGGLQPRACGRPLVAG